MILLTGGAGYIGSHVSVALLDAGLDVVAIDNLSNSNSASLSSGCNPFAGGRSRFGTPTFGMKTRFTRYCVIGSDCGYPFGGAEGRPDSNAEPMTYYENNVLGTMRLVSAMKRASVKTLVFSSSATAYGIPAYLPLDEKHPLGPTNPYAAQSSLSRRC